MGSIAVLPGCKLYMFKEENFSVVDAILASAFSLLNVKGAFDNPVGGRMKFSKLVQT